MTLYNAQNDKLQTLVVQEVNLCHTKFCFDILPPSLISLFVVCLHLDVIFVNLSGFATGAVIRYVGMTAFLLVFLQEICPFCTGKQPSRGEMLISSVFVRNLSLF